MRAGALHKCSSPLVLTLALTPSPLTLVVRELKNKSLVSFKASRQDLPSFTDHDGGSENVDSFADLDGNLLLDLVTHEDVVKQIEDTLNQTCNSSQTLHGYNFRIIFNQKLVNYDTLRFPTIQHKLYYTFTLRAILP